MTARSGLGLVLVACAALGSAACGSALRVVVADSAIQRKGHIALFMSVEDKKGEPVPGLSPASFKITENGKPLSAYEAKLKIWNPLLPAHHYVMVLVDTSGSVGGAPDATRVVDAAKAFASRSASDVNRVGVYRFDGAPKIEQLSDFGADTKAAFADAAKLKPRDISTNLNGAIVEALGVLAQKREAGMTPLHFGSLVIFTDGTDRAHRVAASTARDAIYNTDVDVFVVAVPREIDLEELRVLGKSGYYRHPADIVKLYQDFDSVKARIEQRRRGYYLMSYCTAARAGSHELGVEVKEQKNSGRDGYSFYNFRATEFVPGCEPSDKPEFPWRMRYRRKADEGSETSSSDDELTSQPAGMP